MSCGNEKWQVDTGSTWVGFGEMWRMLANVGEYLLKNVHRYESKFGQKQEFLHVVFDNLSADLENNGHFVYKFGYLCNKINDFRGESPQIEKYDGCTVGYDKTKKFSE